MTEAIKLVTDQVRQDTFTVALDSNRLFWGLGPVVFPTRPDQAASKMMPTALLRPQDDYLICVIGGRKELFGQEDSRLSTLSSEELQRLSLDLMKEWPETTRAIPARCDLKSFFFVEMYTSVPCEVPQSANVTLLRDAIHAMTPKLGRGANIAMRDGALLARYLGDVVQGQRKLEQAINEYETEMTPYGFDAVKKSAAMRVRLVGQNPLPSGS